MSVRTITCNPNTFFPVVPSETKFSSDLNSTYGMNMVVGRLAVEFLQGFRDYLIFQPSKETAPTAHKNFYLFYHQCLEAEKKIYTQQKQSLGTSSSRAFDYIRIISPIFENLRRIRFSFDKKKEVFPEPPALITSENFIEMQKLMNKWLTLNPQVPPGTPPDSKLFDEQNKATTAIVNSILELIKIQFEVRVKFYTAKLTEQDLHEHARVSLPTSIAICQSLLTEIDNLIKERKDEKSMDSKEQGVLLSQLFDVDVSQSLSQSSMSSLEATTLEPECGVEKSLKQQISQEIGFIDSFGASSPLMQKKMRSLIIYRSMAKTKLLAAIMREHSPEDEESSTKKIKRIDFLKASEADISLFKDQINSEDWDDFPSFFLSLSTLFFEKIQALYPFDGPNHCIAHHMDMIKLADITPFSVPCMTTPCQSSLLAPFFAHVHNTNFNNHDASVSSAGRKYITIEASFPETEIMQQLHEVARQYVIKERDTLELFASTMPSALTQSPVFLFEQAVNEKLLHSPLLQVVSIDPIK